MLTQHIGSLENNNTLNSNMEAYNYYYPQPSSWAVTENTNYSNSSSSTSLAHDPNPNPNPNSKANRPNTKSGGFASSSTSSKLSTDPQSVAARERRHRISDRFRILKGLVPGGSKMDTVSMLEEAINYVKFLKGQIWLHQAAMMLSTHEEEEEGEPYINANVGPTEEEMESYSLPPLPPTLDDEEINVPTYFGINYY